jgi:hypothetical protein
VEFSNCGLFVVQYFKSFLADTERMCRLWIRGGMDEGDWNFPPNFPSGDERQAIQTRMLIERDIYVERQSKVIKSSSKDELVYNSDNSEFED